MVAKLHSDNTERCPMRFKQLDFPPQYYGVNHPGDFPVPANGGERRNRVRAQVHWPVIFVRGNGTEAVETITENVTSEGFYCLSSSAFVEGEQLDCILKLPPHDPAGREQVLCLECKVRVARVERLNAQGTFGIACQIEDYRFDYNTTSA